MMAVIKNADGSTSIGILEDMTPAVEPKEEPKEEPVKKPKKATKKK